MAKFGAKEVCDVTFYDLVTGKPVLYLDTLKLSNLENTASSSSARGGKGNPKLLTWDFDREATFQAQDALMTEKSLALLSGNPLSTGVQTVYKRETLKADSANEITLSKAPKNGSLFVYIGDKEIVEGVVGAGKYVLTGQSVELSPTDAPEGTSVDVYYKHDTSTNATKIEITSDAFPTYYKVVGDTVVRNAATGQDEPFQIVIHKAKLQPGFTMSFQADGDPSVFDMNLEVFRRDQDTSMIEMIKYED